MIIAQTDGIATALTSGSFRIDWRVALVRWVKRPVAGIKIELNRYLIRDKKIKNYRAR